MKAFLWVVLLSFLGLCGYFMFLAMVPDDSRMIAIAFGNSTQSEVEMHIELSMMMAGSDTDAYTTDSGSVDWTAWAKAHYVVVDDAGNQVDLGRRIQSNLISDRDTRGYNDSFLVGEVTQDTAYTFTYIPVVGEPEKYMYKFVAPTTDTGRSRVTFKPL